MQKIVSQGGSSSQQCSVDERAVKAAFAAIEEKETDDIRAMTQQEW